MKPRKKSTVSTADLKSHVLPAARVVTSLDELEQLTNEPLKVAVLVRGQPFEFMGRRLRPAEAMEVKLLLERALPPQLPPEKPGGEPRYDFEDRAYLRRLEENRRRARAIGLWQAFPVFKERWAKQSPAEAPLSNHPDGQEALTQFIEHLALDDEVLETLFRALTQDIAEVQKFVDFILGSGRPKS